MSSDLTEEEMRHALFGTPQPEEQVSTPLVPEPVEEVVLAKPLVAPAAKKKVAKAFTPRLKVTLRVGNEFEGKMHEFIHEADCSGLMKPDTHLGENARHIEVSDDQATSCLFR